MMMIIFWDKDGVLLTEYLPSGTTINGPSDASITEQLRSVIVEKGRSKLSREVVLLHDNASIHMFTLLGLIELNDSAYYLDIAMTNSHPLSNLNKFLRSKNLISDDEAVTTVDDYSTDLNSEFFL